MDDTEEDSVMNMDMVLIGEDTIHIGAHTLMGMVAIVITATAATAATEAHTVADTEELDTEAITRLSSTQIND